MDLLKRVASFPLAVLLLGYEALDALFGPLVRPALAWLSSLELFARLGRAIGRLPPYAVLATLAVPFAIIEPFKFVSLYWIAEGHAVTGVIALALAHLSSIFICERIFHAGKARLLRIGWFARGYGVMVRVRTAALTWVRDTVAWRACAAFASRLRGAIPSR